MAWSPCQCNGAGRDHPCPADCPNLLERARDDLERVRGPDDLDTLTTQANLALAYRRAGRLKAAAEPYRQTLAHSGQALGHDHPVTRAVRQSLADLREIPN
jgi:hypothetical protein